MPTLPSTRRHARSSRRAPLRRVLLLAATVVLAAMFAAPAASGKPVTTTITTHQCTPLPDFGSICTDQTISTFTNTVQQGNVLVVNGRADLDAVEVSTFSCILTRTLNFRSSFHHVTTPGGDQEVGHTMTIGGVEGICPSGPISCTFEADFHEVLLPDGTFRTQFDRERSTCD